MNFVKKISFLLSSIFLFLIISCSNGMLNSTNISLCFDVSQLYNKSSDISRNDILLNNNQVFRGKLNVAIYQIKDVNAPESYVDFDDTKFKKISSSSGDVAIDGTVSVVLNEVPVGVKAFIVAELFNEQNGDLELVYAGLSNTFEVTEGTNVVELELRRIVNEVAYNLTFVLGDDAKWNEDYIAPAIYSEEDASIIALPSKENIFRENYIFDGWYDNAEYNGTALINLAGKTGDLTLYARWRSENQVATVQFSEPDGGVDASTNIILTCETENATIYYSYDGKEFSDKWEQDSWLEYTSATSGGITIFAEGSTNPAPVTIYAIAVCDGMENSDVATITYTLNVYTLNFDANGGTLLSGMQSSVPVTSGDTYDFSNIVPTKTGYDFKGWYLSTNPDATENSITRYEPNIENTLNKTVTFYAKWEPITYTVIFNPNDGSALPTYPTQPFTYDVEQALDANPFTRTGYTFTGWNTVEDPTTTPGVSYNDKQSVKNLTTTSESITLYAQWEANKATITVTMPTYSDIQGELKEPTRNDDGDLIFTVPEGVTYTHNIWYVNGKKEKQNASSPTTWTFDTTNLLGGIYTIMLVVEDSNGNKYSAEWQITVEK